MNETGDLDFYTKVLPYADQGDATVLGHLRRALEFNLERTGKHGLPCGLAADWNDCLKLGYYGESLFVAFQVRLGLTVYAEIAEQLGQPEEAALGDRRTRRNWTPTSRPVPGMATGSSGRSREDGTVYGTQEYSEGQVYLNTQVWAVISGAATPAQAVSCHANRQRATGYALRVDALRPAFRQDIH